VAELENVHVGIIGLVLLIGGAAFMETRGILEGIGSLMMIGGVVMLISAWKNRSK
jgi:uncharacterized membrane protein